MFGGVSLSVPLCTALLLLYCMAPMTSCNAGDDCDGEEPMDGAHLEERSRFQDGVTNKVMDEQNQRSTYCTEIQR